MLDSESDTHNPPEHSQSQDVAPADATAAADAHTGCMVPNNLGCEPEQT